MTAWADYHRALFLVIAAIALAVSLAGISLPQDIKLGLLMAGVALLGVPHGALDPLVARGAGIARNRRQFVRFFVVYTILALSMLGLWWLAPALAFSSFLLLSIWHFSNDWDRELDKWQRLAVAAAVIAGPALFWPQQTAEIFSALIPDFHAQLAAFVLNLAGVPIVAAVILIATRQLRRNTGIALELLAIPLLAWTLTPVVFFVAYFCALHSPRHLIDTVIRFSTSLGSTLAAGIALSAVTIAVAVVAFSMLPDADLQDRQLRVVFVGLAALTVPHMWLMHRARRAAA
ncbi:MAG: Brp/Blh family beta-carotene 15,15'-dioxygenase [Pseudomonadota bacterium]